MSTQSYKTRIRTLYALAATFASENPVLLEGEPATESDTGKKKIGDGVTAWNNLPYESFGFNQPYLYAQSTPATTWTINHNLGYRPSVELLDSGSQEIEGDVIHPSLNQTIVTLTPATAGIARLT